MGGLARRPSHSGRPSIRGHHCDRGGWRRAWLARGSQPKLFRKPGVLLTRASIEECAGRSDVAPARAHAAAWRVPGEGVVAEPPAFDAPDGVPAGRQEEDPVSAIDGLAGSVVEPLKEPACGNDQRGGAGRGGGLRGKRAWLTGRERLVATSGARREKAPQRQGADATSGEPEERSPRDALSAIIRGLRRRPFVPGRGETEAVGRPAGSEPRVLPADGW